MATPLDLYFESDASRLAGEVMTYGRVAGRLSQVMEKGALPEGMGFNFSTVISDRTSPSGGITWAEVEAPDGLDNNCVPDQTTISWATTLKSYVAEQALLKSDRICFTDVSRGYLFTEQVGNIRDNFKKNVTDGWEIRDKYHFFTQSGHKIVANGNLTDFSNSTDFGATEPTFPAGQWQLDEIYTQLSQDGGGEKAYAYANGAPVYTAFMSQEAHRDIIKGDASVREDFQFADMGKGAEATLLKSWGVDKTYGGFMHAIDNRMPRYNYDAGVYTEVPFYLNQAAHIGNRAIVNPAYRTAEYEDIYIWNPDVVKRLMAPAPHSAGGGTSFDAVPYTGAITWRNIPSEAENPLSNTGRYWAQLQAAWKPGVTNYGYILRVKRCNTALRQACVAY